MIIRYYLVTDFTFVDQFSNPSRICLKPEVKSILKESSIPYRFYIERKVSEEFLSNRDEWPAPYYPAAWHRKKEYWFYGSLKILAGYSFPARIITYKPYLLLEESDAVMVKLAM